MPEEILFESGALKVTPARVVFGSSTYSVANITSVRAEADDTALFIGVGVGFVGFLLLTLGSGFGRLLGALGLVAGVLIAVFGRATEVVITTGAAEQVAFRSRDAKTALAVASAINLAIMKRHS
jgi:Flp pilus assembly protein protease CpaA